MRETLEEHNKVNNIITLNHTLNTRRKLLFVYSLFMFTPILTIATGSPLPFPYSIFDVTEIQAQIIETVSYTLGIVGTISTGIFYLKRGSDNTHKETRQQINDAESRVCQRIDNKFRSLLEEIKETKEITDAITIEKVRVLQEQIHHLKETDADIKKNINRLENKIFYLRSGDDDDDRTGGGSPL